MYLANHALAKLRTSAMSATLASSLAVASVSLVTSPVRNVRPLMRIAVPHASRARQQHPLNPRVSAVIQLAKRAQAALRTYVAKHATMTQL